MWVLCKMSFSPNYICLISYHSRKEIRKTSDCWTFKWWDTRHQCLILSTLFFAVQPKSYVKVTITHSWIFTTIRWASFCWSENMIYFLCFIYTETVFVFNRQTRLRSWENFPTRSIRRSHGQIWMLWLDSGSDDPANKSLLQLRYSWSGWDG